MRSILYEIEIKEMVSADFLALTKINYCDILKFMIY